MRSGVPYPPLSFCRVTTKVETHSSQREGGTEGGGVGRGQVGYLSCQSKKQTNQKPSSHTSLKKISLQWKNPPKNKQTTTTKKASSQIVRVLFKKNPKQNKNKNKQKVVHSSLNLLRVLRMSWHVTWVRSWFVKVREKRRVLKKSIFGQQGGGMHRWLREVILIGD